jgi:predicted membrane channel-forming protein YqfA (hemolysin III family)
MKWMARFTFSFLALAFVLVYSSMTNPALTGVQKTLMYLVAIAMLVLAVLAAKQRHSR